MPAPSNPAFPATRWSLILDLRSGDAGAAGRALDELCRLYWYPVYAFIRREGSSPEDAQDLAQSFFARLLERGDLSHAQQQRGKLRTFLLSALKNHLVQDWRHRTAEKRGGRNVPVSLDVAAAEQRYASEPADMASPDALFDRRWALDTMEEALRQLEADYTDSGKSALHTALQPFISAKPKGDDTRTLCARLGLNENAIHVAIHRLRQRFRKNLESLVAETVSTQDEVPDELRHLLTLLTSR